jgi:uncharacterized protein YbdZ (MbtH family)
MAKEVNLCSGLSVLAAQIRSVTVQHLSVAEPSMLTWTPHGTSNHVLWHAGHALWVGDILTVQPITGRSELPAGWEATFGEGSQPRTNSNWPDGSEVRGLLETQLARVLAIFSDESSSIAERANEESPLSGWPLLAGIIHGWHDEARHQGEMYLLAKMWRARGA